MADAQVKYKPQGKVLENYLASDKFVQCIRGPLGSGKTTASAFKVFKLICTQTANKQGERKSRWAVIRNTYPDLTNTTIRDWRAVVPDGAGHMTMGHPPEMKLDFDLPDGTRVIAEVIFVALDKPDDIRKLRGMQLTGAWVNEGKEVPKAIIDMLTGRVDRYPKPGFSNWVGIIMDTNAWDSDHYLETWAQAVREGNPDFAHYAFFVQPGAVLKVNGRWEVNPEAENLAVLKPDYYARQIAGKREDWIKVNLANEIGYAFDGKPVHPDYSDSYHCAEAVLSPTEGRLCRVGMDFGLTPAAAFLQRQADGTWIQFDEIAEDDGSAEDLARLLSAKIADWEARIPGLSWSFRGDPAGDERQQTDNNTVFNVLRMNGIPALPASTNDVTVRRDALDRVLTRTVAGKPGFRMSPTCKVSRKGLAGAFCYKRVQIAAGEERYRDVPDKNMFSHICEAIEYGLMDGGEHSVRDARKGPQLQRPVMQNNQWDPFKV
jgi:hypothetical protein